jgi:signal transduction histidine kinase/HAMP domain-containing protein
VRKGGRLSRKYTIALVALVTGALVASGAVQLYGSYNEAKAALVALQAEKARAAASRIETFVKEIERQLGWTTQPQLVGAAAALDQRRQDSYRLQRQVPPITELSHLDASGREQLRISRLAIDVVGSQVDHSQDPKFREAKTGRTYFGPVYFRKESEPYMTISMPQSGGGVTVAEVNLKFIWDVISQIKVGKAGLAYVVDGNGVLIAHPDISLVLQKTSLDGLEQVRAALTPGQDAIAIAHDPKGREVLTAHSRIAPLGWVVFVDQPLEEAFEPLRASARRTGLLVIVGIVLSVVVSALLARRMARPIQVLQESAAKIGAGDLEHQIDLRSGDELETLADDFNRMTSRLRESYVTLEQKVEDRTRELTEALEQQTATAEILRVISSSPTNVQPVFDSIAAKALDLCRATTGWVYRFDGELIHIAAAHSLRPEAVEVVRHSYPMPPSRGGATARAVLTRTIVYIPNVGEDNEYRLEALAQAAAYVSVLAVPMLLENKPIGVITVTGAEAGAFSQRQIALLQTFADQAVIAIENVRLFKELEEKNRTITEALEQQTATGDILRVISSSPTDIQPVMRAVAQSAARLTDGARALIGQVEGDSFFWLASSEGAVGARRYPVTRALASGRAILDRETTQEPDLAELVAEHPYLAGATQVDRVRTCLATPLLREGVAVGVLMVYRTEVRPFTEKQVALLQTFADQAVIAIENVRLFQELQARTAELTRSVGELEALGEVSRAISSTLDLDRVLATVASRANQLAETDGGAIYEFDQGSRALRLRATDGFPEEFVALLRTTPLVYGEGAVGRTVMTREPVQVANVMDTDAYTSRVRDALVRHGYQSLLAIPLLSEDEVVGALVVNRKAAGAFPDRTVGLLRTFASQSALAIENARLFSEIEDKSRQLEEANQHKSEFLASVSHELRTPLNAIIGFSEVMLERLFGEVNEKQEEYLNDILSSGRHLLSLINDILDLAKIEAGRMELELGAFDVPQAIDNTLMLVRERAMRRGIVLERSVEPRLGEISGDERKVKQVLLNLLSNAVKFTPEGGRIEVRAVVADGTVEISVSDTGVGIAPEDHEAVFEEFRQVGSDYARRHEGTGLGLALARRFVELHGGRIWVKSQVGQGSTFTFAIPMRSSWQAS